VGAGRDAELDGLSGPGAGHLLDLGEFGAGSGEADLEAFDFAEPSFAAGFFDTGQQIVADIEEALALGWVGAQERAAQAGLTEMILRWAGGQSDILSVTLSHQGIFARCGSRACCLMNAAV
jgi:hypothetical protein